MEKIKSKITNYIESEKGKDILIVIIVILLGLGSFELGRLSKEDNSSGVKIEYPNQDNNNNTDTTLSQSAQINKNPAISTNDSINKAFFASSKGSKYYTISCSAGKTIKQENRIYFATSEEAENAGYQLSGGCN